MSMTISAMTVNTVLQTVRDISGAQYDRLLDHCGWSRFREAIPPVSSDLVATREELERLFTHTYTLLGEELMRLFLRNYGRLLVVHIPGLPRMQATAATRPPEQQLGWFVEEMAQMSTRNWTPVAVAEDGQAYYLTFDRCPMCAGIHGAHDPICAGIESLYGQLAYRLLQRRVRVVEVECAAAGARRCKVAIYKP